MPEDLEGIICMGSFGALLILYGILGPHTITRIIEKMDGEPDPPVDQDED